MIGQVIEQPPATPDAAPERRPTRRIADAIIGALCGALAGVVGATLAPPQGVPVAPVAIGLAVLAGALGYRYGRGIAAVVLEAFTGTGGGH